MAKLTAPQRRLGIVMAAAGHCEVIAAAERPARLNQALHGVANLFFGHSPAEHLRESTLPDSMFDRCLMPCFRS